MKKLLIILLSLFSLAAYSQDKITKLNGEVIDVKVTEVGTTEIKYYYSDNPKVIFGIAKEKIEKIDFSTGESVTFSKDSFKDEEYYIGQNKNLLKVNFLSPLFGSTEFVYERSINPGSSFELGLGIIGLGWDAYELDASGAIFKFAYKFIRKPSYYVSNMHYAHILKGAYIAPELALRYTDLLDNNYDNPSEVQDLSIALTIKFGKQWVFNNNLAIDWFFGVGYGKQSTKDVLIPYGFIASAGDTPISMTSGLRIGFLW